MRSYKGTLVGGNLESDSRKPGLDRNKWCWRCCEAGHVAGTCTGKPRCYLCAARKDKRISPETATFQGLCVARLFGRQPPRGNREKPRIKAKQAGQKDAEVGRIAPIDNDPEVMLTRFPASLSGEETGEFRF